MCSVLHIVIRDMDHAYGKIAVGYFAMDGIVLSSVAWAIL